MKNKIADKQKHTFLAASTRDLNIRKSLPAGMSAAQRQSVIKRERESILANTNLQMSVK